MCSAETPECRHDNARQAVRIDGTAVNAESTGQLVEEEKKAGEEASCSASSEENPSGTEPGRKLIGGLTSQWLQLARHGSRT